MDPVQQNQAQESDYDSDYSSVHYDLSRTVSDKSDTTNSDVADDVERTRLEFARKLGYSDGQVQVALSKLGPHPSQNELLAELIQLDSANDSNSSLDQPITTTSASATPNNSLSMELRHIVIDGSNVAMSHGCNKVFSCYGIKIVVDWFKKRGHQEITVFVPSFRKSSQEEVRDPHLLTELESAGYLVFTPSRQLVNNKRLVCYDDRYILRLALETDGVIVSNDNYRDLQLESSDFKRVVEEKILMYSFVNDRFMPPDDPLGRNGPNLEQFLSKNVQKSTAPPCPYGRKCTYGVKCKYFHPVIKQSVSDTLRKQALQLQQTQSLPLGNAMGASAGLLNTKPLLNRVRSAEPPSNGHRRLRREFSVNPSGDPRIPGHGPGGIGQQRTTSIGSLMTNQPISTFQQQSSSATDLNQQQYHLSPFPTQPHLSAVWGPPCNNATTTIGASAGGVNNQQQDHDHVYYHLSAIFPPHQVQHVMNLYKDERDPQVLCKHIIRLFS